MRDLTDDPTWEDDLTNIGPETGDDANGEEVSVIGDKLGNRTRWARSHLFGAWLLVDRASFVNAAVATVADLASETSYIPIVTITGTVNLVAGDRIELPSEVHVLREGAGALSVTSQVNTSPGGAPTWVNDTDRIFGVTDDGQIAAPYSWTGHFSVVGGMAGFPLQARIAAKEYAAGGISRILSPTVRALRVWRKVTV